MKTDKQLFDELFEIKTKRTFAERLGSFLGTALVAIILIVLISIGVLVAVFIWAQILAL